jgi:hypothetical protein
MQLLNVHGACDVRQTEMHTAEPFVPEPSASEFGVAIGKLKSYKSPGVDQIPVKLIHTGGETLRTGIHKLIKLIWNKEELPHQWKSPLRYLFTKRAIKLTVVITEAYHCSQIHTKFYQIFFSLGYLHMQMQLLGNINVDFDVIDRGLIKFCISGRYWRKNGSIIVQYFSYL